MSDAAVVVVLIVGVKESLAITGVGMALGLRHRLDGGSLHETSGAVRLTGNLNEE
jgi:CBS-domain-containing membrane protein